MDFHVTTWLLSVAAVVLSGALAWAQGNFTRREGLDMGFANHGGMWSDLVLLPIANAAIVPHLDPGAWIAVALVMTLAVSVWVHIHWYRGDRRDSIAGSESPVGGEHMWPSRRHGSWWRDLSWAGWAHVLYVAGELALLVGFLLFPMPQQAIVLVCVVFTLHVPLGLLQPRWYLTGEIAALRNQPLLVPLLGMLWIVAIVKTGLPD